MKLDQLRAFSMVFLLVITGCLALISAVPDTVRGPPIDHYHNGYIHLNVTKNDGSPASGFKAYWNSYRSSSTTPTRYLDSNGEGILNLTFDNLGMGYLLIDEDSGVIKRYRELMVMGPDEHNFRNISLSTPITNYNNISGILINGTDGSPQAGVSLYCSISDEYQNSFPDFTVSGSDGRFQFLMPNSSIGKVGIIAYPFEKLLMAQYGFFYEPGVHHYDVELTMRPRYESDVLSRVRYLNGTGSPFISGSVSLSLAARDNDHINYQLPNEGPDLDGWFNFNGSLGEGQLSYYGNHPEHSDIELRTTSYYIHNGTEIDLEILVSLPSMVPLEVYIHNGTDPIEGAGSVMQMSENGPYGSLSLEHRNTTNSAGFLNLWVPEGEVTSLYCYSWNYYSQNVDVDTTQPGPYSIEVQLEAPEQSPPVQKSLMNITVIDDLSGIPVQYARVTGYGLNGDVEAYLSANMDDEGTWSGLAPVGNYNMITANHGLGTGSISNVIHTSDEVTEIEIRIERYSAPDQEFGEKYSFYLVDQSGVPVPNVLIMVSTYIRSDAQTSELVYSDDDGQVWLPGNPGKSIYANSVQYINENQINPWVIPYTKYQAPDDTRVLPNITAYPRPSLDPVIGMVKDSISLEPLPDAYISCLSVKRMNEGPSRKVPIGNGIGSFTEGVEYFNMARRSVPGGFYRIWGTGTGIIQASATGYYSYIDEVQIGGTRVEIQHDILLEPYPDVYGWVNGTLVDENDMPISGFITLEDLDHPAEWNYHYEINETGEFSFLMYPGNYTLIFQNDTQSDSIDIQLTVDGMDDLVLKLIPRSILGATVLNIDEEPIEGSNVTLIQGTEVLDRTMTDADGEFTILVPAGSYDILIERSELYNSYSMNDIEMDGWTELMTTIYLDNRTMADIIGTILGSDGPYTDGIPGVEVSIFNGEIEVSSTLTDMNGDFEILNVDHGLYALKAIPPESLMPMENVRSGYLSNITMNFTITGYLFAVNPVLEYVVNSPPGFVNISYYAPNGTDIYLDTPVVIEFSEVMNKSAVEASIMFEPILMNVSFTWDEWGYLLSIDHDPFGSNTTYTITIGVGAVSVDGWPFNDNLEFSWEFTTGMDTDPWMIFDATVSQLDMNLSVEVTAPTNLSIFIMVSDLGFYLLDEISEGEYYQLINASEFDYDITYSYYFTDRDNGDIKAPQYAGSFKTPEAPNTTPVWEIFGADVTIVDSGDWVVSVSAEEDLDIYLVIEGVGSFKLVEGPPGTYEALITYDNFEELEQYQYHFSDEDGGEDLAPFHSESLIQPIRAPETETDYVLGWWTICVGGCLGIILIIILILVVIVVIKKKGKSDKNFDEE